MRSLTSKPNNDRPCIDSSRNVSLSAPTDVPGYATGYVDFQGPF